MKKPGKPGQKKVKLDSRQLAKEMRVAEEARLSSKITKKIIRKTTNSNPKSKETAKKTLKMVNLTELVELQDTQESMPKLSKTTSVTTPQRKRAASQMPGLDMNQLQQSAKA